MEKSDFTRALRNLADELDANPDLPAPDLFSMAGKILQCTYVGDCGTFAADTKDGLAAFARIVGGRVEKCADEDSYELIAQRDGFEFRTWTPRNNVCELVQVSTKLEPEHVIPAQPEQVVPAREVPVYEYRCPSLLASEEVAQ